MRWSRWLGPERGGAAMLVVLAFMALAVPTITATLAFTSTASIASRELRNTSKAQFTVTGAMEYAVYKLVKVPAFRPTLSPGVPFYEFITLNDADGAISWTKRTIPGGTPPAEATLFAATMTVDTYWIPANTPTTVTYTVEVTNVSAATATVDEVRDGLPRDVNYVTGSTTGATTADPQETMMSVTDNSGSPAGLPFRQLIWEMGIVLGPGQSLVFSFDADIDTTDKYVCNTAWVNPGGHDAGTGPTAKIQVGSPAGTLCLNEALDVRKTVTPSVASDGIETTFTYLIEFENFDSVEHQIDRIYDLLPPGLSYVGGSESKNFQTAPATNAVLYANGGRQAMKWKAKNGDHLLPPNNTKWIQFDVIGTLQEGHYENEVWVEFISIGDFVYSFPTAEITVWDIYDLVVANDKIHATAQVWINGDGDYHVTEWEVTEAP